MFTKIKLLISGIIKYQSIFVFILLSIWIIPQIFIKINNYQYDFISILFNIFVIFLVYGIKAIKHAKIYNITKSILEDNSLIYIAEFTLNVFWLTFLLLLFIYILNNIIPGIITYYIGLFLSFLLNIFAVQSWNYYNEFNKNINYNFLNKLEA